MHVCARKPINNLFEQVTFRDDEGTHFRAVLEYGDRWFCIPEETRVTPDGDSWPKPGKVLSLLREAFIERHTILPSTDLELLILESGFGRNMRIRHIAECPIEKLPGMNWVNADVRRGVALIEDALAAANAEEGGGADYHRLRVLDNQLPRETWRYFYEEQSGKVIQRDRYYGFWDAGGVLDSQGHATALEADNAYLRYHEDLLAKDYSNDPSRLGDAGCCVITGEEFVEQLMKRGNYRQWGFFVGPEC